MARRRAGAQTATHDKFNPRVFTMYLQEGSLTRPEWIEVHDKRLANLILHIERYEEMFLYGKEPITPKMRQDYADFVIGRTKRAYNLIRSENAAIIPPKPH